MGRDREAFWDNRYGQVNEAIDRLRRSSWTVWEAGQWFHGIDGFGFPVDKNCPDLEVALEGLPLPSSFLSFFYTVRDAIQVRELRGSEVLVFMGEAVRRDRYTDDPTDKPFYIEDMCMERFPVRAFLRFARTVWFPLGHDVPCFDLFHDLTEELKTPEGAPYRPIQEPMSELFANALAELEAESPSEDGAPSQNGELSSYPCEKDATLLTAEDETLGEQAPSFDMEPCAASASSEDKSSDALTDYSFSRWFDGERSPLEWVLRTIEEWAGIPEDRRTNEALKAALNRAAVKAAKAAQNPKADEVKGLTDAQINAINTIVLPLGGRGGRGNERRFKLPMNKKN